MAIAKAVPSHVVDAHHLGLRRGGVPVDGWMAPGEALGPIVVKG